MDETNNLLEEILERLATLRPYYEDISGCDQFDCKHYGEAGAFPEEVYSVSEVDAVIGDIRDSIKHYRMERHHEEVMEACAG